MCADFGEIQYKEIIWDVLDIYIYNKMEQVKKVR